MSGACAHWRRRAGVECTGRWKLFLTQVNGAPGRRKAAVKAGNGRGVCANCFRAYSPRVPSPDVLQRRRCRRRCVRMRFGMPT
jgi:hypothetical protein